MSFQGFIVLFGVGSLSKEEKPADVDLIIVATMSPDAYTPAPAALVQAAIGAETLSKLIDWQGGYFINCRADHLRHLRRL